MAPTKSIAKRDWFTLRSLVSRDFKIKYRRSVLGVLWSILNPLLMMVVMSVVFSYMFKFDIWKFPVYLILGNTLFSFMSEATNTSMMSILDSAPLIKKIKINKFMFPLEKVSFALLNFIISLIAVAAVMIYFQIEPTINLLLLPYLLVCLFLFCLGLGLLLSALSVFFRDVVHLWSVLLTAWTYMTPLFYPVELLESWMMKIMLCNPMYHYVTYFRNIAMWNVTPTLTDNAIILAFGVVMFAIGFLVFKKLQGKFILYV